MWEPEEHIELKEINGMDTDYREQGGGQGGAEKWGGNVISNVNLQRMSTQQTINTGVNGLAP